MVAAFTVPELASQMSWPVKLHPSVGGEWSQKLFAAKIVIGVGAPVKRSAPLQEITFPPALPPADVVPRSPPATSYSTPTPLPVMTLCSTLLPTPPLMKPRPEPGLFKIWFPVITWFVEASTFTPYRLSPVIVLFRRITLLLLSMSPS